jgi:hypothetical protein
MQQRVILYAFQGHSFPFEDLEITRIYSLPAGRCRMCERLKSKAID